jgi:hypothetical protein
MVRHPCVARSRNHRATTSGDIDFTYSTGFESTASVRNAMKLFISSSILLFLLPGTTWATQDGDQAYLPYGARIAPNVEINLPPQPFDERIHGHAIPNTIPNANMVGRSGVRLPDRFYTMNRGEYTPTFEPGSGDRGLWLMGARESMPEIVPVSRCRYQTPLLGPQSMLQPTCLPETHVWRR